MDVVHQRLSEEALLTIRFQDILGALDATLRKPGELVLGAQRFQALTLKIYLRADLAATWAEAQQKKDSFNPSMIEFFRDTCVLLLDRYDEARPFIIKGCCYLCVVGGPLGRQAMAIAAAACRGAHRQEAVGVVLEVLEPLLEVIDSLALLQLAIMESLTCLPQAKEFAACLQPIIHNLVGGVVRDPWATEYLGLLRTACLDEDNVVDVLQYGLAARLIPEMRNYEQTRGALSAREEDVDRLCQVLETVGLTLRGAHPALLSQFFGELLVPNLKRLIGEREGTARLTAAQARICNALVRIATAATLCSQAAFEELCFGYHLFDLLVVPVKEAVADPLVLAAALQGLAVLMENARSGEAFVAAFAEEVDVATLLAYLKPERMQKLAQLHGERASALLRAVADFVAHLLALARRQPRICQLVDAMYDKGLAVLVLDAMAHGVADDSVRAALVRALARFPVERVDAGAVAVMLALLVPGNIREFEPQVFEYIVSALAHKLDVYAMEPIVERTCWLLMATLKTPEAHRYQALHLGCVQLLQKASSTRTGQLLLRAEQNALSLRKALKYEEDFCAYDHADVRVELTCVGGDVAFLSACMFDTFKLKRDRRQLFRVFRAVNRALADGVFEPAEEELLTIEAICACEVRDFEEEPLRRRVGTVEVISTDDEGEDSIAGTVAESSNPGNSNVSTLMGTVPPQGAEPPLSEVGMTETAFDLHREKQRQLFLSMEMPKRIVSYLSGSFSATFTERYQQERRRKQHSEYWAGILKGRKLDCERFQVVDKFDWSIDCAGVFSGEELAEGTQLGEGMGTAIAKPARQLVSYVVGQKLGADQDARNAADPFYRVLPRLLLHKVWVNECTKTLNPCFVVSSYLRTLHALMAPSVSAVVRDAVKRHFRDPEFVRSVVKLTACATFLDANLAAKMLRVCVRALTIDAWVQAESMDVIVVYDVLARFAAGLCEPLRELVASVSVEWVDDSMQHVQLVLLQTFRAFALFARQMPWIKFSSVLEIQEHFVERCVVRCVPEGVLSLALQILFEIVALETASSMGTYVSHLYRSDLLEQLREACVDMAVGVACAARNTHCPHLLNAIGEQRRSNSLLLRQTLVADLLRRIRLAALGRAFQERVSEKRLERVLLMDDVWVVADGGAVEPGVVALTSRRIYLLSSRHEDTLKVNTKFSANADVWEVSDGLMHVIFAPAAAAGATEAPDGQWVVLTLRHTPAAEFRRFVTAGNSAFLSQRASEALGAPPTYLGVCQHDSRICLAALTADKLAIFAINHVRLVEHMLDPQHGEESGAARSARPSEGEGGSAEAGSAERPAEPLDLLLECYSDSIKRVTYGADLEVVMYVKDTEGSGGDEEWTCEVTFVSDSRREAFKKALSRSIGHLVWFRRWERAGG